jgi:Concanavalin A-like lectin/glucanases superfamily
MRPRLPGCLAFLVAMSGYSFSQSGMLTFTNTSSAVTVPNAADLTPPSGLTVEAWIFFDPNALGGFGTPTIVRKDPAAYVYILRNQSGAGGYLQWMVRAPGQVLPTILISPFSTPQLVWIHVAGTYDGSTMNLYVDGFLINSDPHTGTLPVTGGPLLIGQGGVVSDMWKGNLDEVRIWSVARTAAEIQSTRLKRIDNHPGLVAAWHFDGNFLDLTGGHTASPLAGAAIAPSTSPVMGVYLEAPGTSTVGAPLNLGVHTFPNSPYMTEISASGISPGTPVPPPGTGTFPLNQPFLHSLLGPLLPSLFGGFSGITNAVGGAAATVFVPPDAALAGFVVSAAFVVLDPSAPWGIGPISNATQTLLVP